MLNWASADEQYRKDASLKKSDVATLLEWCKWQPHLPTLTELEAALFLYSCYCSNEAAKTCIEHYFACRRQCPEFFAELDPTCSDLQTAMDIGLMCLLPKQTPKGYVIAYFRLAITNPDPFRFDLMVKEIDLFFMLHLRRDGCSLGHATILDMEGVQLKHLLKSGPIAIKKFLFYLQNAMPLRLKEIHFVNGSSIMDRLLALVKPFIKKELLDHLHVHCGTNETIFEHIPPECLPKECGGEIENLEEIFVEQRRCIEENAAYFIEEEKKVVDLSKSPTKQSNAQELFGMAGTFKQMSID